MLRASCMSRLLAANAITWGVALSAQAGPAMFQASFLMQRRANDVTTGTFHPYNTYTFIGMPLGHNCQSFYSYTYYGTPAPYYCSQTTLQAGSPATGSGTLASGSLTVGGSIGLPSKAFGHGNWLGSGTPSLPPWTTPISARNGITGFLPIYYPYLQSHTYATFHNAAGTFVAGNGPAAGGTIFRSGKAKRLGSWRVTPKPGGAHLGGAMTILGRLGAHRQYVNPLRPGTHDGTGSRNMIKAMGRTWGTSMAPADTMNPYTKTDAYYNSAYQTTSTISALATGSLWTTGDVTVYAKTSYFTTIVRRGGFDTTTGTGTTKVRNLQLVTPVLTHWQGPIVNLHTGHIGVLNLQLTAAPEPSAVLLLAAGGGVLALLYRFKRKS